MSYIRYFNVCNEVCHDLEKHAGDLSTIPRTSGFGIGNTSITNASSVSALTRFVLREQIGTVLLNGSLTLSKGDGISWQSIVAVPRIKDALGRLGPTARPESV